MKAHTLAQTYGLTAIISPPESLLNWTIYTEFRALTILVLPKTKPQRLGLQHPKVIPKQIINYDTPPTYKPTIMLHSP